MHNYKPQNTKQQNHNANATSHQPHKSKNRLSLPKLKNSHSIYIEMTIHKPILLPKEKHSKHHV
jgi:hypothetical protein